MATIPGNPFIELCAANAAETFRRREADVAARVRRNLEAQRQARLRVVAQDRARRLAEAGLLEVELEP